MVWATPAAAQTGAVAGTVSNAETGEALPGANVVVAGTAIGAATDFDGKYQLSAVPVGSQVLVATYLGFQVDSVAVEVQGGQRLTLDFELQPDVIQGETVEVTAQLEGQLAAINQQRSSNTIVNVVSKDRIQELPDQNVAESVGRLSGVSLQRDGGEGAKVQVRGLNPAFSSVTINGERIPGTDAADRSVDLSLISSDLLAGIELFKALTPDKDADAIGGTVNLIVANARPGLRGDVRVQGGYNDLRGTYDNVRLNGTLSDRFLDNRLGAVLTGNFQRADRSSDGIDADYDNFIRVIDPRDITAYHVSETRDRYGAGLTLDYDLGTAGGLQLRGLYSRTDRDDVRRRNRFRIGEQDAERQVRTRFRTVDLVSLGFRGEHAFAGLGGLGVKYNASFSRAENQQPEGFEARFRQTVFTDADGVQRPIYPQDGAERDIFALARDARLSVDDTGLNSWRRLRVESLDRDLTASTDLSYPLRLGGASVALQAGAKYRGKQRDQDETRFELLNGEVAGIDALSMSQIGMAEGLPSAGGGIALSPFVASSSDPLAVLDGQVSLLETIDVDQLTSLSERYIDNFVENPFFNRNDFEASEDVAAGYGMAEVNAGPLLVAGGVRYEHTRTAYTGRVGSLIPGLSLQLGANPDAALRDTSGSASYGLFFPQVVTRLNVGSGFDVRAAVTRTLARPDYLDLVFRENVNDNDAEIERGNPDVRPTTAWNLDVSASHLSRFGLFSVGAFYKNLNDFFYDTSFRLEDGPFRGFQVFETVNGEAAQVYGFEVEAQLNFTFLPGALSGFLLNANYAYSESEADFPIQIPDRFDLETGELFSRIETRSEQLPGQSPHVVNVSLGYERGGFSGRLSLSHQSAFLSVVPNPVFSYDFEDIDPETGQIAATEEVPIDVVTEPYTFVDLQLTQEIPTPVGRRLRLVGSLNNVFDEPEAQRRATGQVIEDEQFGLTADFGLRLEF
jgi:TonB-dependent receptor